MENIIIRYFAVVPGAVSLNWLTPGTTVEWDGTRIISKLAILNVLKGCEGTETLLILYSAIIAILRPWDITLIGLFLGTILVFVLNQLRIIGLFFIVAFKPNYFEVVHGVVAPALILVTIAIFFIGWLYCLPSSDASQPKL